MDEYNEQLQNTQRESDRLSALVSSLQQSLDEAQFVSVGYIIFVEYDSVARTP